MLALGFSEEIQKVAGVTQEYMNESIEVQETIDEISILAARLVAYREASEDDLLKRYIADAMDNLQLIGRLVIYIVKKHEENCESDDESGRDTD